MDKVKSTNDSWELPPLRGMNDFLLEPWRFQLPNFKDLEKWGNRVVNNLVYYQTNYLYMCIAIILVTASVNPLKVMVGTLTILVIWGECIYLFSNKPSLLKIKRSYPQVGVVLTIACALFVLYTISALLFLLLGIFMSFCMTFIHASLRLRNMKNKIVNKIEGLGIERTPMGILLNYIEHTTGITLRTRTTFIQSFH